MQLKSNTLTLVPCSERLPETSGEYVAFYGRGEISGAMSMHFSAGPERGWNLPREIHDVRFWAEMPRLIEIEDPKDSAR